MAERIISVVMLMMEVEIVTVPSSEGDGTDGGDSMESGVDGDGTGN